MKPLEGMTALVTGASRGIGAAAAALLAEAGADIVVHYNAAREAAESTARECERRGASAAVVQADLRNFAELDRLKETLDAAGLSPDILVNNAGISHYGLFTDVTAQDWEDVVGVNLKGMFRLTQLLVPAMISRRYGRIINISSVWGVAGASCEALYSLTKGGVNAFTKALAKELAPSGVTVNAVAPGAVETDMMRGFDEEELAALRADIPAGRLARPEEIASLIRFLASPESGYITGQIISPNGGWLT
jgi:3-oxoacyl-[acyl-carrier protein] reductase